MGNPDNINTPGNNSRGINHMSHHVYRGLFAVVLAFYGCIGSQSIMSRGTQSRAAIDGDGEPINMDTTLDYIDMAATTVGELKDFIVPGYAEKVTKPEVEDIITNSVKVLPKGEIVGKWEWSAGESKEQDDDFKTLGLWFKEGRWYAYVTDALIPKHTGMSILSGSAEGLETDTTVTVTIQGLSYSFTRNGDTPLASYAIDVYTADVDNNGQPRTDKVKREEPTWSLYMSEPYMYEGEEIRNYVVLDDADKTNIQIIGTTCEKSSEKEILLKIEDSKAYYIIPKQTDVLGLVFKPEVEEYAAMKIKLDQIAALEPPESTVIDLITWANAVQSILKGELMGGDSSISPSAVLSSSNKYYWDEQTETCYRMTVENNYTIMRAVTNVPPTVEVVLALEKGLNEDTNK